MNDIYLFISHSWKYNDQYEKLVELLKNRGYFRFRNYSVPQKDPLDITGRQYENELREAIRNQMSLAQVVLIIAGKYVAYSDTIQMEIDLASEMGKPIIAIRPYGANQISSYAERVADELVSWNADSIVAAIRRII